MANGADILYAYELYVRMVREVRVDGIPLTDITLSSGWSAWEPAAQLAFMVDLAGWTREKCVPKTGPVSFSGLCVGAVLFAWSLVSLMLCMIRPRRALLFSVDKESGPHRTDFRIGKVYARLRTHHTPFIEFFHTTVSVGSLKRMLLRFRPAFYLEGLDWWYHITHKPGTTPELSGLETFSELEADIVRSTVTKYVQARGLFEYRIRAVRRILKMCGVQIVLGVDDARHYHSLATASLELGIPFYAFQHAHVTPYHVGWLGGLGGRRARPSKMIVWNEYWKKEFETLGAVWPPDDLIVGGSPKHDVAATLCRGGPGSPVVIPYETEAPKSAVQELVRELVASGVRVLYKLRPDVSHADQLAVLGVEAKLVTPTTIIDEPVRAVVGTYSTYLYDALAIGVPAVVLKTELRFAERLVASGLVVSAQLGSVGRALSATDLLSNEECARRAEVVRPADMFDSVLGELLQSVA